MHAIHPAALMLGCTFAHAGIHIEVSGSGEVPDGLDTFGAAIGQTETLNVWIWSDEPGVFIQDVEFDLFATVFGSTEPNADWYEIHALGMPDPDDRFDLFAVTGVLVPEGSRISGVLMAALPTPGSLVELPVGPDAALLVYQNFTGEPRVFTGGVLAANVTIRDGNFQALPVTSHGWYQIPAPGLPAIAASCVALAIRRRRC